MFNNKLKKSLYERAINKQLTQTALNINDINIFQIYKIQLMALNNCIIWYDNNYKRFLFILTLKPVISEPVIKPIKEKIMDWEVSVAAINLNQKNIYYIKKKESQKKKTKWINKEKLKKKIKKK